MSGGLAAGGARPECGAAGTAVADGPTGHETGSVRPPDPDSCPGRRDPVPGSLLFGQVMHRRFFPVRYRFVYRVFGLFLDLDRIGETAAGLRLFSHNRFNLFAFYDRDHGPGDGTPLRAWLERGIRRLGLDLPVGRIEIQCFPRVLGYGFNPLSVWYCWRARPEASDPGEATGERAADELVAILCEVHNTFGERHGYLLHREGQAMDWPVRHAHAKGFHVSPFVGMQADYRFRFARAGDERSTVIHEYQDGELMLVAVQRGQIRPITDVGLLRAALAYPFMTLKVVAMIHWHALRIWLKGATYFPKPPPPREEMS